MKLPMSNWVESREMCISLEERERERWYKRRREREGSKERKWRRNVGERVNSRDELNACELTRATESSPGMVVTV